MADNDPLLTTAATPANGFADVVAEILDEAEQRRARGEYSDDLLAEIDREFLKWAPIASRQGGIDDAIRAVESASFINVEAPVAGGRRGVARIKLLLKKATAFYHLHIAGQVTGLGIQVARVLRLLADKVDGLDGRVQALELATSLAPEPDPWPAPALPAWVTADLTARPSPLGGRILVTDAGAGHLVRALAAAGHDVYGATSRPAAGDDPLLVAEPPLVHLRAVRPQALGAVVLAGLEGHLTPAGAVEVVQLAADRLEGHGTVVVVAPHPDRWAEEVGPVVVDLAPGRVLRGATWAALLERAGFTVQATDRDGVSLLWATR